MTPFLTNTIVSVITLIYVFVVVAVMDFFVKKGFPQDLSRKVVHIAAASWLFCWFFIDATHWSMYFNILPAFVWFLLLLQKGFFAGPNDDAVKTMTRKGDRRELLRGPLYFTIVMMVMGTYFLNSEYALITMGILGFGDGLAPVVGTRYGKMKYKIFSEKTVEGSITFFICGIIGSILFSQIILGYFSFGLIIKLSIAATVIEALSPRDVDNLLIPIITFLVFFII